MKEYVIRDIHGGYLALKALIEKLSLAPEDRLIFLGDYVDGWSEPVETVDYLCELKARYNTILLMGNHDSLALDWLLNGTANDLWLSHGCAATVAAYQKVSENKKKAHISFYTALMPYYLDSKNRLFIHAGFTNQKGVAKNILKKYFTGTGLFGKVLFLLTLEFLQIALYIPNAFCVTAKSLLATAL